MHTHGPWKQDEEHTGGARAVIGDGQQLVALVYGKTTDEQAANARLVANTEGFFATLKNIATQKTTEELQAEGEQEYDDADFEGGYDALIHIARRSIQPVT